MSLEPRPWTRPPETSPPNGSLAHLRVPSGTTSMWPVRQSAGRILFLPGPGAPPRSAAPAQAPDDVDREPRRRGAGRWARPAPRPPPAPGGLTVSSRTSSCASATTLTRTPLPSPVSELARRAHGRRRAPYLAAQQRAEPAAQEPDGDRDDRRVGELDRRALRVRTRPDLRTQDDQNRRGDQAAGHAGDRARRVEARPEQRAQQRRQVGAGGDREGEADQERDVESRSGQDRDEDRHDAEADRGHPGDAQLFLLVRLPATDRRRSRDRAPRRPTR